MLKKQGTRKKKKVVIFFSVEKKDKNIDELSGSLSKQKEEDKLMSSVLKGKNTKEGRIIRDAINQGIFSFNPDIMFQHITQNYSLAKQIYGESLLREIVGDFNDANIPEVKRSLKNTIKKTIEQLKLDGFLTKDLDISENGLKLAALSLYVEELNHLIAKGLIGEKINKERSHYGDSKDIRPYRHGDRYRDIALKKSIKNSIRHLHSEIQKQDLSVSKRESRGQIYVTYAIDASGSMKGSKIENCKKAGIALAYKAINEKDCVGLLVFGSDIEDVIEPTHDFMLVLNSIARVRAKKETNIAATILRAVEMFPSHNATKHLIIITDAMPTFGLEPEKETLDAASKASTVGITISLVGVGLDDSSKKLAEQIVAIGRGKLYTLKALDNLDTVVLDDYNSL